MHLREILWARTNERNRWTLCLGTADGSHTSRFAIQPRKHFRFIHNKICLLFSLKWFFGCTGY